MFFYYSKSEQIFENDGFIPFYRTNIVVDQSHEENMFGKYVRYLMADDIGVWETEEILCGNQAEILTAEELPLQRDIWRIHRRAAAGNFPGAQP